MTTQKTTRKRPPFDTSAWPTEHGRDGPRAGDMMFTIRAPRDLVARARVKAHARGVDLSGVVRAHLLAYVRSK